MAGKTNFTPEEWGRVLASPLVAAMAITAADPSGLWGLLKESLSGGFAILEARQDTNANPLVRDVARDFATRRDARYRALLCRRGFPASRLTPSRTQRLMS